MSDSLAETLRVAVEKWYEGERVNGNVNTNVMNVGLIVSEMVREGLPLSLERLQSKGGSQVRGLSGKAVSRILERHGEMRPFTVEGGRTSRGTLNLAHALREVVNKAIGDKSLAADDAAEVALALEKYFTGCVRADYMDKQRIKVNIDASQPVSQTVGKILAATAERQDCPTGPVMQHLVGAKLELRFPEENIGRDRANAADQQTSREGDFQVGTTAFHVTTAPMEKLIRRCRENHESGFRPILLVPSGKVAAAIQLAEVGKISEVVGVQSVESFVGTNIEELATYDEERIKIGVARLVRTYNNRIREIETDQSLRVEEPSWVERLVGSDEGN